MSVEIYVILAVVAAAILALASRPASARQAEQILMGCALEEDADARIPAVRMECLDNGRILVTRTGVSDLCGDGAVSLAIEIKGLDMRIEERIVPGKGLRLPSVTASCVLPFIRLDRYHVAYNSASTGLFTAFTFPARPGATVERGLQL